MTTTLYTTKTAALKATKADISSINAKHIKANGKNVLTDAKHASDIREEITENDVWSDWIETKNGEIILHDEIENFINEVTYATEFEEDYLWNSSVTSVKDNKAYIGEEFYANIQTNKIKTGGYHVNGDIRNGIPLRRYGLFRNSSNLTNFTSGLNSLIDGYFTFYNCKNLTSFRGNLESLMDGTEMFSGCKSLYDIETNFPSLKKATSMFYGCESLKSFKFDLINLESGYSTFKNCKKLYQFTSDLKHMNNSNYMFSGCSLLENFNAELSSVRESSYMFENCEKLQHFKNNLSNLISSNNMFTGCSSLESFTADLSSLVVAKNMFRGCNKLSSFVSDLGSLMSASNMFTNCKLDTASLLHISDSIKNIDEEKEKYISGEIPYVTYVFDSETSSYLYSANFGYKEDGTYVYTVGEGQYTISPSEIGKIDICLLNETPSDEEIEMLEEIKSKGWIIYLNGSTTPFEN